MQGVEYVVQTFNEATKNNQGDEWKSSSKHYRHEKNIMLAQPGGAKCPVKSFKLYVSKLNPKLDCFFQRPNVHMLNPTTGHWYDNMAFCKGQIQDFMKHIEAAGGLSQPYTNHSIRNTTCTAMGDGNHPVQDIAKVLNQGNVESVRSYLGRPTMKKKIGFNKTLAAYSHEDENNPPPIQKQQAPKELLSTISEAPRSTVPNLEEEGPSSVSVPPKSPTVNVNLPLAIPTFDPNKENQVSTQNVSNTFSQISNNPPSLFHEAVFHNCTINFNKN